MVKDNKRIGCWRFFLFGMVACIALLLIPPLQVISLRWFDPLTTGTAAQRFLEFKLQPSQELHVAPEWRILWTPAQRIPRSFYRLVWASEDQRFFEHSGFDWIELRKAWDERGEGGGRGASTISMQTARTIFLWQGRSWVRKVLEAYYTVWLELLLGKSRIFYLYVNVAEMGPGIYGVGAAARHHFGRRPGQLNLQEQALLVAILPNPRNADPEKPGPWLRKRQARVLRLAANAKEPPELRRMNK